jgi:hypothetical protein
VAPGGGEASARLRELDEGNVACVIPAVLAEAGRLGFEARRLLVSTSGSGDRGAGGRGAGALDAWLAAGRPSFGLGWRDDGDRPIRLGVPSNLEYDAARAILAASRERLLTGIRDARAAALHWRAFDRGLEGLPWVHAPDHAGSASEPGHVWVEGLLDVSYLTDDRALRTDLTRVGDALAVKASDADDYLERLLAWPLLALSALERTESGRGYGEAAGAYARALGACEVGDSGALAFGARRSSAGGLTFSPWLGGGLVGTALDAYVRATGDAEAERLLGRLCEFVVEEAYDPRARGFARVLVRDEGGTGGWRREGILRGVRNLPILATLARRELREPSPARAAALRSVFQSSQADVFREPFERCHWWSLAFRCLTPFEFP